MPTVSKRKATAAKVSGSVARTPKMREATTRAERERGSQAQRDSEENWFHAIATTIRTTSCAGAKSDSNADFAEPRPRRRKERYRCRGSEDQRKAGE